MKYLWLLYLLSGLVLIFFLHTGTYGYIGVWVMASVPLAIFHYFIWEITGGDTRDMVYVPPAGSAEQNSLYIAQQMLDNQEDTHDYHASHPYTSPPWW